MRDVALHAEVSIATVARVLSAPDMVSLKTRAHVQKTIRELGYVPNRMAGALKNRNTGILGNIMLSVEQNPYFAMVRETLRTSAQTYGYHVMTMTTDKNERKKSYMIDELMGWMVEGIIFTGEITLSPEEIRRIVDRKIPIIMIERPIDIPGADKVIIDDMEGTGLVADKFISLGHQHTAFIGVSRSQNVEINRFEGYQQALKRHQTELLEKDQIFVEDYTIDDGYQGAKQLFARYADQARTEMPTGIFASCDILACGVLQYLYERELRVPRDISIIGYDNTTSTSSSPQISTVSLPFEEIGKTALSLFLERKEQKRISGKCVQLSPSFVDRNSVRNLKLGDAAL